MKQKKTVIIIAGPTASGKTALAIELAEKLNTSIISADSRQCFKELNIGVAKPTTEELHRVKHYFISSHSIHENVTAQTFEQYALNAAQEIFNENDFVVMAGGTGLYIKAFCEGFDEIPEVKEELRREIIDNYNAKGLVWLQDELKQNDPVFWKTAEQQNPQRLMRALEVLYSTGESITTFRKKKNKKRNFDIIKIGLQISKEELIRNINNRVGKMIEDGLEKEARSLLPCNKLNALRTVGYNEMFQLFNGKYTLDDCIQQIKANTRQYAKRQMTWFKKDSLMNWIDKTHLPFTENFLNNYFK